MVKPVHTQLKGEAFLAYIRLKCKPGKEIEYIEGMGNIRFDGILSRVLTDRTRDPNISKFKLPTLARPKMLTLFELILENNECGLHNSYWSRIIWMVKGGRLGKAFPSNSKMDEFERGQRRASAH